MENPVAAVKSAINISSLIKLLVGFIVVSAIFELIGLTSFLYSPIAAFKAKFMPAAPAAS